MAHFSDRPFSANKLIIAAAVIIYAGAVTFAHAAQGENNLTHAYRLVTEMCNDGSAKACDAQGALFLVLKKQGYCASPDDGSVMVRCPK
jgi:hypothetical protein